MKEDIYNFIDSNRKLYTLFIGVLLILGSCSKELLDKEPLDALSKTVVYNDLNLMTALVSSTYNGIASIHNGDRMGTETLGDLAYWFREFQNGVGNYTNALVDATNGEETTKDLWTRSYATIRKINQFLEDIKESSLKQEDIDPLIGQMRFIRAYLYFDMMRWYGEVPLITTYYTLEDENFEVARSNVEDIVAYISTETDAIIPLLPEEGPRSRPSKAAAMALKAKTLLYAASPLFNPSNEMSKWQVAADANKAVMELTNYPLEDNYESLFNDSDIDDEIIFAREYNKDINQGAWSGANVLLWSGSLGGWSNVVPTNKYISYFERSTDGVRPLLYNETTNTISINSAATDFDPKDPYADLDPRFNAQMTFNQSIYKGKTMEYWRSYSNDGTGAPDGRTPVDYGVDDTGAGDKTQTGLNFIKYTDPTVGVLQSNNEAATNTPEIIFRTAEFYLNYAECQIALGQEDNARAAINKVRARPSVNMPPISATGSDLVAAYRRERAIELLLEDARWFDIRRWKIAEDVLGKPKLGTWIEKLSDGTFMYDYSRVPQDIGGYTWDDKLYLLPIPQSEITKSNGALNQNPGY